MELSMLRMRSTTITTTQPNELLALIHDRMPVILYPADYARWLPEEKASQKEFKAILRPAPAESVECHPVGAAAGNLKNNSASLIERVKAQRGLGHLLCWTVQSNHHAYLVHWSPSLSAPAGQPNPSMHAPGGAGAKVPDTEGPSCARSHTPLNSPIPSPHQ
jgi:hypothetical protein